VAQNKKPDLRWLIGFLVIVTGYGMGGLAGYLPTFFPIVEGGLWFYLSGVCLLIVVTLGLVIWQFRAEPKPEPPPPVPPPSNPPIVVSSPPVNISISSELLRQPTAEPVAPPVAPLSTPAEPSVALPSSLQRPALPPVVQRREAELDQLEQQFGSSAAVVIVGKGGQGKSTFANLYADRWLKQRGKLFWYDAERGKLSGDQIVVYVLAALGWREGVDYRPGDYKLGELGGLLADRVAQADANWLLIVSGLDEGDCDGDGLLTDPELRTLLERGCGGLGGSRLLLTARDRLLHGGKFGQPSYYPLGLLDHEASHALLRDNLPQPERFAVEKLRRAVGKNYADGYPYALTLLINALRNSPLDDVAAYFDELLAKPGQWYKAQGGGGSLLLEGVWAGLARRGGLQATVQQVAVWQRPTTATDIGGMLGEMQQSVAFDAASLRQPALRDLLEQSNVEGQTAYTLHPLLRDYVLEQLGAAATAEYRRSAARHLQVRYFAAHDPQRNPSRTVADVQPLLDAFDQLVAAQEYEDAAHLMFVNVEQGRERLHLYNKLDRWGEARRLVQMWSVLVESGALTEEQQGVVLNNLGNAYSRFGEYRKSIGYYEQRLQIAEQIGDERGKGASLTGLGNAYQRLGEYRKAIGYVEQALPVFERIGDEHGKGASLTGLGNAYSNLSEYRKAIGYVEQALLVFERIGDEQGKGAAEGSLGLAYSNLGEYRKTIGYCKQALSTFERIGDLSGQGTSWNNIGVAYKRLKLYREALACYLKVQPLVGRLGNPDHVAANERNIAGVRAAVGEAGWAEAERLVADPQWRPAWPPGVDAADGLGGDGRSMNNRRT